jgi:hypothetical protein
VRQPEDKAANYYVKRLYGNRSKAIDEKERPGKKKSGASDAPMHIGDAEWPGARQPFRRKTSEAPRASFCLTSYCQRRADSPTSRNFPRPIARPYAEAVAQQRVLRIAKVENTRSRENRHLVSPRAESNRCAIPMKQHHARAVLYNIVRIVLLLIFTFGENQRDVHRGVSWQLAP